MTGLLCPKEFMLITPVVCVSALFVIIYQYLLEINFRFQPKVCNGCHGLMQKVMSFYDVAIISA